MLIEEVRTGQLIGVDTTAAQMLTVNDSVIFHIRYLLADVVVLEGEQRHWYIRKRDYLAIVDPAMSTARPGMEHRI